MQKGHTVDVLRLPVYACGTRCRHIGDNRTVQTVAKDLHICLMYGTMAPSDIFAKECHLEIILLTYKHN